MAPQRRNPIRARARAIAVRATHPFERTKDLGWADGALASVGMWLACSGVLWNQSMAARVNEHLVGGLVLGFATLAYWFDSARVVNAVLAVWLAISAQLVFRLSGAPAWNAYLTAIVVFVLALWPPASERATHRGAL